MLLNCCVPVMPQTNATFTGIMSLLSSALEKEKKKLFASLFSSVLTIFFSFYDDS